jgi:uncharacterized protein (TIGR02001 family)
MNWPIARSARSEAAAALLAAVLLAAPALADGLPTRGRVPAAQQPQPEQRTCTLSANAALTTDYIFRGFSQTAEGPAVQGGFDATCSPLYGLYAGVWASSLDFAGGHGGTFSIDTLYDASVEMDWYAGIKPKTGPVAWDLGVIYYSYPDALDRSLGFGHRSLNYAELKLGASAEVWKDGTLGLTAFYSPDYQLESGRTWTFEAGFVQAFSPIWMVTPSISALGGFQTNRGTASYRFTYGNGEDQYFYWNAGLTLGFLEKWSLDLRYWDTDLSNAGHFCDGGATGTFQCDARFVATLKFTY